MKCMWIKHLLMQIGGNIEEAREKILEAYQWQDKSEVIARWHKDMAAQHLAFNEPAVTMVRKHIEEMRSEHKDEHGEPDKGMMGKCEVYEEWLEHLLPGMAEARAMVDRFGK